MSETSSHLLLCKRDDWSGRAVDLATALFGERLRVERGNVGDPPPAALAEVGGGVILSFLSPWIVPAEPLARAALALNFHPGSRDYPGIGCYNFALYEAAREYGPVCHHMTARVDRGAVVAERLFPVFAEDTVETLKLRTMVSMLDLFHDILSRLRSGAPLPETGRSWTRDPFRRRDLDALCRITPDLPADEIRRRVRATTYPGYPGAAIELGGVRFAAPVPARAPLA